MTKADDVIVSDKLISPMLSQVSEQRQLTGAFGTFFSGSGSEICLRPAELRIEAGASVDLYTVLACGVQAACGVRLRRLRRLRWLRRLGRARASSGPGGG